jgi:hypothetical protein
MENQNQPLDQQNDQEQNRETQNQENTQGANPSGNNYGNAQQDDQRSSGVIPNEELEGSDADTDPGMRENEGQEDIPEGPEGEEEEGDMGEDDPDGEEDDLDDATGGTAI